MHETVVNMVSSAAAGIIGRLIFHPIDTVKANMQSLHSHLGNTIKKESIGTSIRALYRGLGVVLVAGTPATICYFNTYEIAKSYLEKHTFLRNSEFSVYLCGGLCAEIVSCILFVPTDVIKERMQVQGAVRFNSNTAGNAVPSQAEYYRSAMDAVRKISRKEGMFGFYKGYGASIISFGPFSAIYFAMYEGLKKSLANLENGTVKELKFQDNLLCSSFAGASAAWITNPLDLAKLRLQLRRAAKEKISNDSLDSTFGQMRHIYKTEGARVFFKGAGARVLFHAPTTAVTVSWTHTLALQTHFGLLHCVQSLTVPNHYHSHSQSHSHSTC